MSVRPAFYIGSRGLIFGWHGPLGPMLARYESASRELPAFAVGLGFPGTTLPVTPEISVGADHVLVAWCEEDGAWMARYGLDGEVRFGPKLMLPRARAIAIAAGRERGTLFGSDGSRFLWVGLDRQGDPLGGVQTLDGESRAAPRLSAVHVDSRNESLCVAVHRGSREWATLTVYPGEDVEHTLVRHRAGLVLNDVQARAVRSRSAVLFCGADRVEVSLIGEKGKVIERPHPVYPRGIGALDSPDAVWADDRWMVLARSPERQEILARPFTKEEPTFSLAGCEGRFSAIYRSQTYYTLEVQTEGDTAWFCLGRCSKTGEQHSRRRSAVENLAGRSIRLRREVRGLFQSYASGMQRGSARGYRDGLARPEVTRDGTQIELVDAQGSLRITGGPTPDGARVELSVRSGIGEFDLAEVPSSLVRLAQWIRGRFSSASRREEQLRTAWATELAEALEAQLVEVTRAGDQVILALVLERLPTTERFHAWVKRLRDSQPLRL